MQCKISHYNSIIVDHIQNIVYVLLICRRVEPDNGGRSGASRLNGWGRAREGREGGEAQKERGRKNRGVTSS